MKYVEIVPEGIRVFPNGEVEIPNKLALRWMKRVKARPEREGKRARQEASCD